MDKDNVTIGQLKAEANACQTEANARGKEMKRGHALEAVARNHGYANWRAAHAGLSADTVSPKPQADGNGLASPTTQTPPPTESPVESWVVRRSDDTALRFRGIVLGASTTESDVNDYYDRTTIYRSVRGKYIAERVFDEFRLERPKRRAATFSEASAMVAWLRDTDGNLGDTELNALEKAAQRDDAIDQAFAEEVG